MKKGEVLDESERSCYFVLVKLQNTGLQHAQSLGSFQYRSYMWHNWRGMNGCFIKTLKKVAVFLSFFLFFCAQFHWCGTWTWVHSYGLLRLMLSFCLEPFVADACTSRWETFVYIKSRHVTTGVCENPSESPIPSKLITNMAFRGQLLYPKV